MEEVEEVYPPRRQPSPLQLTDPRFSFRSAKEIAELYQRGADVVGPFLRQWGCREEEEREEDGEYFGDGVSEGEAWVAEVAEVEEV